MQTGLLEGAFISLLCLAALSDLWKFLIPNTISIALAALFVVAMLFGNHVDLWLSHVGGGLLVFVVGMVMFHFRLFGGGDVKLLAATALWTGLELLPALLLVMGLLGGVVAISLFGVRILLRRIGPSLFARGEATLPRLFTRGEKIPYGVAIGGAGIFLASRIPLFMP